MKALIETSNLGKLTYDWKALVFEEHLESEEEIAEFLEMQLKDLEELNGYYRDMLVSMPTHKPYFDTEYRSRRLEDHIAPEQEELDFFTNPSNISKNLIIDVAKAKNLAELQSHLTGYHGKTVSALLCMSLVIALCIEKTDLAGELKLHICQTHTYERIAKEFLLSIEEPVINKIVEFFQEYISQVNIYNQHRRERRNTNLKEAASTLTPLEKMELFNQGKRRENVKACSINKLTNYYKICLENGLKTAERQIEVELRNRNAGVYIKPNVVIIDGYQFTPYEAKFVIERADDPDAIIIAAAQQPFPDLGESDTLTIYLIWAMVLNETKVMKAIRDAMKRYDTYFSLMPEIINEVCAKQDILEKISDITKTL